MKQPVNGVSKKAIAAADDEEGKMRLQEFFVKHSNCKQIENER